MLYISSILKSLLEKKGGGGIITKTCFIIVALSLAVCIYTIDWVCMANKFKATLIIEPNPPETTLVNKGENLIHLTFKPHVRHDMGYLIF